VAIGLLLILLGTWSYAYGKINHDILLAAVPLVLSGSWVDRPRAPRNAEPTGRAWPAALLALIIALALFTAGYAKWATGWLDSGTSATRFHILHNHVVTGRGGALTEAVLRWSDPAFWEFGDIATVGLELAFIPALLTPGLFRIACAAAVMFHLGIWLTMEITFVTNVLAYGAFLRWDRLPGLVPAPWWRRTASRKSGAGRPSRKHRVGLVVGVALAVAATFSIWNNPITRVQEALIGASFTRPAILVLAAIVASAYLVRLLFQGVHSARSTLAKAKISGEVGSVLLFDGVCNLCNGWVDFLIRRDRRARLRFASLQSGWAERLGFLDDGRIDGDLASVVLVHDGHVFTESDAAIRSAAALGRWYGLAGLCLILPRFLRDDTYRLIARNRYRLFGKRSTCRVPTPEERSRFVE
jgi:predicted DCC family thiol-disulfide oxidoreductase YuxK/uncharacterized membrane protein YphA (DoxX/SURF4 family)